MSRRLVPLILVLLLFAAACNKAKQSSESTQPNNAAQPAQQQQQAANPPQATPPPQVTPSQPEPPKEMAESKAPGAAQKTRAEMPQSDVAPAPKPAPKPPVIPAGTAITIRLGDTIDAKTAKAGDTFHGTVSQPVSVHGVTLVPASSTVTGTVVEAEPPGKFKGEGSLSIHLTQLTVKGVSYPVSTATVANSVKGKGKRSAVAIGGGTAGGALIGGLAGGGKGAAIGALVGGGAGTAGAAMTGNKALTFPAESAVTFKTLHPVTLGRHAGAEGDEQHAGMQGADTSTQQEPQH